MSDDFAELAAQYSEAPDTKKHGGDVGWFSRGIMRLVFEEAAFALQAGDIVETSAGCHLIKLTGRGR